MLEAKYLAKVGEDERTLTLPVTVAEGTTLSAFEVWLTDEPPTIRQPTSARVVYQHHWWRGKVKPVRVGPSLEHWDLRIDWHPQKPLMNWILRDDISAVDATNAVFEWCKDREWMKKGEKGPEYIPPGKPGNPTKDTPAYIEIVDSGTARIYEFGDMFGKMDLRMRKLKGHLVFIRRDERLNLWVVQWESPKPEVR